MSYGDLVVHNYNDYIFHFLCTLIHVFVLVKIGQVQIVYNVRGGPDVATSLAVWNYFSVIIRNILQGKACDGVMDCGDNSDKYKCYAVLDPLAAQLHCLFTYFSEC